MQLFCDSKRAEVKEANPGAEFKTLSTLLGAAWKDASNDEKAPFIAQNQVCWFSPLRFSTLFVVCMQFCPSLADSLQCICMHVDEPMAVAGVSQTPIKISPWLMMTMHAKHATHAWHAMPVTCSF